MAAVQINDRGNRIGESHHRAVLSDAEIDQLLEDRGPEDSPVRSYGQLARKYKISKTAVADIVKGRRRGQRGVIVDRKASVLGRNDKVKLQVRVSLKARAKISRKGGGAWLEKLVMDAK